MHRKNFEYDDNIHAFIFITIVFFSIIDILINKCLQTIYPIQHNIILIKKILHFNRKEMSYEK